MSDLVSIIVPIYGVEEYLSKCIDSIINQTYKNLEIILVDDGSPDKCPDICDAFEKKDERMDYLMQEMPVLILHMETISFLLIAMIGLKTQW